MSINRVLLLSFVLLAVSCTATVDLPSKSTQSVFSGDPSSAADLAEDYANAWIDGAGAWALSDIDELVTSRIDLDSLGMAHVRLDQTEGGVPVFGGQVILHLLPSGQVASITDGLVRGLRANTSQQVDRDGGIDIALAMHSDVVDTVDADLQILRVGDSDHLTWRVQIDSFDTDTPSRPVVFVDARTGNVVWRYDNLQTIKNRMTYDGRNRSKLPGRLERSEGDGPVNDVPIDDAHDHAGITYDYYLAIEGRDSIDANGTTLISTAHHKRNYDNAFWDGTQMVYGDGDVYFTPLSGALDVVGHELTHAVTEFSANLVYADESGGLNEATSDILGVAIEAWNQGWVIDGDTWLVGEDIATPALGVALRHMDDPTADGVSIDNYADYTPGLNVHYSSGIANKAFYLMATSGSLDLQAAAHVWYRGLTLYMTPSTTFSEGRTATVDAATDLYGAGSPQVAAVEAAWTSVGVAPGLDYLVIDEQTGLAAATGNQLNYSYATSAGSLGIKFLTAGGTGDADLYVRFGAAPTTATYDCRPWATGNTEACTFEPSQVGTYYVMINAYQGFSGLTLTVSEAGGEPPPPSEVCDDGVDNDLDGLTDCDDSDCALDLACAEPEVCDDGIDNDLDGDTDCADADCALDLACAVPEVCDDGVDNDLDGLTDCDDLGDCELDAFCLPDEVCDDGVDNDLDGLTDCDDADCDFDLACALPEVCDDGIDNDLDGLTDCSDSDCDLAPECATSCPGGEFAGTLSASNKDDYVTDTVAASGLFEAALSGDAGTDFDLHLQWHNGSRWRDRTKSNLGGTSDEFISYNEGSVVLHRWRIRRRSGNGSYTLCVQ